MNKRLNNKLVFSLGFPVFLFTACLYFFWTNELFYVLTRSVPVSLRDPEQLPFFKWGYIITMLFFLFSFWILPAILIYFLYAKFKQELSLNTKPVWTVFTFYTLYFVLILFYNYSPYVTLNPLSALTWFLD